MRLAAATLIALAVSAGAAQAACPPGVPAEVACGLPDFKLADAGVYAIDADHAAVIVRVPHIGYSHLVFRFDRLNGALTWDPARPEASKLSVAVETASLATNVKDFAPQLVGDGFLKSQAFPKATFVSTAFRRIDARHGKVDGQFTLMGKTKPLTFDVTLAGAGKGFGGSARIGVQATAIIDPRDYGLPPMMVDPVDIVIDAEFAQQPK